MTNKVTYRQQYTRCGKDRCRKCKEGTGHGPYWYAYWSENGRTISKYIGTRPPADLANSSHAGNIPVPSLEPPEVSIQSQDSPIVRIYLLGQFRIEYQNHNESQVADSRPSHRRRTRALLGCLLSSPSRRLAREQVMNMLWPDLEIDLAANRLNGAVHELRQILEPDISRPSSSRLLRLERDIFELADNTLIWVDAEAFEQLLKEAETSTDIQEVEDLLEKAATLYQGNYLPEELYSEWTAPRRDALQRAWVDLQLRLTQIKVAQGAYISAIEILDRLRTADPTNETALQQLMTLLTHLDRRAEALQVYKQFRAMLHRDYEGIPLPETTALYEKLRKGDISPLSSIVRTGSAQGTRSTQGNRSAQGNGSAQGTIPTAIDHEEIDDTLSYIRPLFLPGHRNQSPLIGREQERQRMQHLLLTIEQQAGQQTSSKIEIALPSPTHFLLLIGEPGIGKTRMAEELGLEAYNRGWTVAWSRSYEQEGTLPYHPWTEILRKLLGLGDAQSLETFSELAAPSPIGTGQLQGISRSPLPSARGLAPALESKQQPGHPLKLEQLSALLPELTDHIHSAPPSPGVSHERQRLQLWEAILDLLTTLSKFHPLLLVFDDLHWTDDSSIELLTYLTHHLQGQRVLLIGTCRDGELEPQHRLRWLTAELQRKQAMTIIPIHPLTPSQIGTLVSYLPKELISIIQTQSSGNPFFAEELARFVNPHSGEQEQLDVFSFTKNTEWENTAPPPQAPARLDTSSALPDAIGAVLERRLHRLSKECHTLLSRAAVLGDSFKVEQLLSMAPEHNEDTVLDFLEEALHAGLLTEKGEGAHVVYHFWHPLITSYLYNHLSAARRAQLHRRAAALSTTNKSDLPEGNHPGQNQNL